MKKGLIVIIAIVAVIAILGGSLVSTYNGLVDKQANVENADAQSKILFEKNQELEKSLEEAKEEISQSIAVAVEETKTEENSQEKSEITQMDLEIFEKIDQVTKLTEDSYIDPPK